MPRNDQKRPSSLLRPEYCLAALGLVAPVLALYSGPAMTVLVAASALAAMSTGKARRALIGHFPLIPAVILALTVLWAAIGIAWTIDPAGAAAWKLLRLSLLWGCGLIVVACAAAVDPARGGPLRLLAPAGIALAIAIMAFEFTADAPILHAVSHYVPQDWQAVLDRYNRGVSVLALTMWPAAAILWPRSRAGALVLLAAALVAVIAYSNTTATVGVALAAVAGGAAWLAPRRTPLVLAALFTAIVLAAPIAARLAPSTSGIANRPDAVIGSFEHRRRIWQFAAERIADHPVRGWGFQASRTIPGGDRLIGRNAQQMPLHPHNAGLQWWLELGLPGGVLGGAMILWCVARIRAIAATPRLSAAASALATSSFVIAESSYGAWQSWWNAALFAAAALMIAAVRLEARGATAAAGSSARAALRADGAPARRRPHLLYFVTEDWYFWSHRLNIADAAREAGCAVTVVTRVNAYRNLLRERGFRAIDIHLQRGRILSPMELRTIAEIVMIYCRERPDIVHHVGLKPVLYGGLAAAVAAVPVRISALAGLGYIFMTSSPFIRAVRVLIRAAMKRILGDPRSWLILQNRDDMAQFLDRGIAVAERTALIRGSGVDTQRFHITAFPPPPIVVAQVSRMIRDKGVNDLVEAATILRRRKVDVRILLVGESDSDNPSAVPEDELRRWSAEGIVEWLGFRPDVMDVWRNAHIAVLGSYREGMPKSLLEAGACGRPLIATDVPGNRELVIDGQTGLLVPCGDAAALAAAIERLCGDPELRERLGRNARSMVVREFSDEKVVTATMDLYARAAKDRWPAARPASPVRRG